MLISRAAKDSKFTPYCRSSVSRQRRAKNKTNKNNNKNKTKKKQTKITTPHETPTIHVNDRAPFVWHFSTRHLAKLNSKQKLRLSTQLDSFKKPSRKAINLAVGRMTFVFLSFKTNAMGVGILPVVTSTLIEAARQRSTDDWNSIWIFELKQESFTSQKLFEDALKLATTYF